MPKRWTPYEEKNKREELYGLYVVKNLTIGEISKILKISEGSVYERLLRLNIKPTPYLKKGYKNYQNIPLPQYSSSLAECIGILLGDGHISHEQIFVMLGDKESLYVQHVANLFEKVFRIKPKHQIRSNKYSVIYLSSVKIVKFLMNMGLVSNKVREQVSIPQWIFESVEFEKSFLRGFFDTDGSAYNLRYGFQISFCNRSRPLLEGANKILSDLSFGPSNISGYNFYITKRRYLRKFLEEIKPAHNQKFIKLKIFLLRADTQVVNEGAL